MVILCSACVIKSQNAKNHNFRKIIPKKTYKTPRRIEYPLHLFLTLNQRDYPFLYLSYYIFLDKCVNFLIDFFEAYLRNSFHESMFIPTTKSGGTLSRS